MNTERGFECCGWSVVSVLQSLRIAKLCGKVPTTSSEHVESLDEEFFKDDNGSHTSNSAFEVGKFQSTSYSVQMCPSVMLIGLKQ